ncbi:MAG: hypothetical protein MR711_08700 [Selenomonas sp.]|uniref:hypothetical protein n=1 Tax=Selenomonas sp. TaxID=2053611 RepID=UPI0025DD1985|nr:hypothetical protein [Selenomonas sp.]MCI6086308.1 hypothetical protein [Selenomonas sp.]
MEKLLLFGTGRFYQRRREKLYAMLGQDEIVGFLDNRAEKKASLMDDRFTCRESFLAFPMIASSS